MSDFDISGGILNILSDGQERRITEIMKEMESKLHAPKMSINAVRGALKLLLSKNQITSRKDDFTTIYKIASRQVRSA